MTSINGQVGGFRKEVGYPKLPALLIASSLVLILEDVFGWSTECFANRGVVGDDVENILRF